MLVSLTACVNSLRRLTGKRGISVHYVPSLTPDIVTLSVAIIASSGARLQKVRLVVLVLGWVMPRKTGRSEPGSVRLCGLLTCQRLSINGDL